MKYEQKVGKIKSKITRKFLKKSKSKTERLTNKRIAYLSKIGDFDRASGINPNGGMLGWSN